MEGYLYMCVDNIGAVSMIMLVAGLKIEGIVKWRALKLQGALYR